MSGRLFLNSLGTQALPHPENFQISWVLAGLSRPLRIPAAEDHSRRSDLLAESDAANTSSGCRAEGLLTTNAAGRDGQLVAGKSLLKFNFGPSTAVPDPVPTLDSPNR